VFQPHDVDLHAVADLLAMAIQRCDLLDREAESEAIRRSELLKTALLSSLSHDLRTPIAAISAAATSLNQYGALLEHESRVEMLDTIQTQCRRLDRFTAKLLSLGQLQGGLAPSDMEVVDVADTLGSAIGQVRALQFGRAITKNVEATAALVWANPAMLEQVLFNILENAVSYTPANTPITVRVTTTPETVEISVADEGDGITAKDLPYIFDRFYRSTNRRDKSGQGLGLSIARGFIEAFGGTISAKSPFAHGKGTQLCIELPLVKSPVEALLHG
jgi:two-component system sensor histidine kinase KdpD